MRKNYIPPSDVEWLEDSQPMINTTREADEWILNDIYNIIGYQFKGYKTDNPYLAYALIYQLTRRKTIFNDFQFSIYADEETDWETNKIIYRVWLVSVD